MFIYFDVTCHYLFTKTKGVSAVLSIHVDPYFKSRNVSDLIDVPITIHVTNFNEESLSSFKENMTKAWSKNQPVIPIIIDSFGGSIYSLLGMISLIELSPVPVATIVMSKAFSAGAMLFSFGTKGYRFIHPDASLLYHSLSACVSGEIENMKTHMDHLDNLNKMIFEKLSRYIGKPKNYLEKIILNKKKDVYFYPQQAIDMGLADYCTVPMLKVELKANIEIQFAKGKEKK